jgi:hypothetical protein
LSWWVSPKRTRSYPYARVYDTLSFEGKKVTIIPLLKDEGKDGDRDFLQWDTVSLMSLLGIYVIITYYKSAEKSIRYENKITNQKFDFKHIKKELNLLLTYQSDALHWNLSQIEKINNIANKAINSYIKISKITGVEMHSNELAKKRVLEITKSKDSFMNFSRELAQKAQKRESITKQPKEKLFGLKTTITIKNYLGGFYFFTCDEVKIIDKCLYLVEGKHSKYKIIPSEEDIKDGLIKMILFTNLKEIYLDGKKYCYKPVLKLTSDIDYKKSQITERDINILKTLNNEAIFNGFKVILNNKELSEIIKDL